MNTVKMEQQKKIHPHKFTMWVGIGSILMMFAGLTSAYIVKRNQVNWVTFELPLAFWYSTAVIIASSITMHLSAKLFRERNMPKYRALLTVTAILGLLFIGLQIIGFQQLWQKGITLQASVSYSFLYVIVGLHGLHVIGGVIALVVIFAKAFNTKIRSYNNVPIDVMSTYWHFVDLLWLYLLVFLIMIK
jgi:cytochrome c oxidase subunit III